jgi:sulfoxide reductase heme-binding subunit YedZ
MRLTARTLVLLGAALGLILVWSSDQIIPAASVYQAQMRIWLVARAAGITAYAVLTFVIVTGLVLSHPVNKSTWKVSKTLFPWHENLFVFVVAFVVGHVVSLILDPYAGVGIAGSLVPGLSSYRTVPVAVGTLALYALLVTALTARYTKLLRPGWWLKLHRLSIVVWALSWTHGIVAGTDSSPIQPLYVGSGVAVLAAAAYRYWVGKQHRPTFATSIEAPTRSVRARGSSTGLTASRPADAGTIRLEEAP